MAVTYPDYSQYDPEQNEHHYVEFYTELKFFDEGDTLVTLKYPINSGWGMDENGPASYASPTPTVREWHDAFVSADGANVTYDYENNYYIHHSRWYSTRLVRVDRTYSVTEVTP